jgi:hypothetical protein
MEESERATRLTLAAQSAYERLVMAKGDSRDRLLLEYRQASRRAQAARDLDHALFTLEYKAADLAKARKAEHNARMAHVSSHDVDRTHNRLEKAIARKKEAIAALRNAAIGLIKAEDADRACYDADPIAVELS